MTADAMLGFCGAMIGGAACFAMGFHCAIKWLAAELERREIDLDGPTIRRRLHHDRHRY